MKTATPHPFSPADRPDPTQVAVWASLDPVQKLEIAKRLHHEALALKRAWLRQEDPEIPEATLEARLRAWQLYGRTDLD